RSSCFPPACWAAGASGWPSAVLGAGALRLLHANAPGLELLAPVRDLPAADHPHQQRHQGEAAVVDRIGHALNRLDERCEIHFFGNPRLARTEHNSRSVSRGVVDWRRPEFFFNSLTRVAAGTVKLRAVCCVSALVPGLMRRFLTGRSQRPR